MDNQILSHKYNIFGRNGQENSQVKTPPPKCATYSQTSHRHKSVPDLHKCEHCHHLASHVHLTVYLSTCLSVRLKTADYDGCRLNMLSSPFLTGPKRQIVDATNSGWLPALQAHFQCNIFIIKMYTDSKTTWIVGETVSFYFRLCSMIYLFLEWRN